MSSYYEQKPGAFDPAAVATACVESGSHALLVDAPALPPAFFDLSSGVAGELLHRLTLYGIRMAGVVPDPSVHSGAFQSFHVETNRGSQVRFFPTRAEAVEWLESA
jgi:uncharacterized protein DUF4180